MKMSLTKKNEIKISRITEKHLKNNSVKIWEPENFQLQTTTIWSFPKRGNWATHRGDYRGNWAPEIPRNLILRYSNKGDLVLDPFVGSGTTLIECKLLGRKGIGIDINPDAIKLAKKRLEFSKLFEQPQELRIGDARDLNFIEDGSIDLICAHPPYADAIQYTNGIKGDLSLIKNVDDFIKEIEKVAKECYRVLKYGKFCCVLIGDIRRKKRVIPIGFKVMNAFLNSGFILKEIIIKLQHECKTTPLWEKKSLEFNFLLLAHEYLFVFEKIKDKL
ncbi:MAG: DNA methyltransferase [Candidatus Aenigmatarchaeota archaeon]